jgi:hypothetical protein
VAAMPGEATPPRRTRSQKRGNGTDSKNERSGFAITVRREYQTEQNSAASAQQARRGLAVIAPPWPERVLRRVLIGHFESVGTVEFGCQTEALNGGPVTKRAARAAPMPSGRLAVVVLLRLQQHQFAVDGQSVERDGEPPPSETRGSSISNIGAAF